MDKNYLSSDLSVVTFEYIQGVTHHPQGIEGSWTMVVPLGAGQWVTPSGNTVDRKVMMAVLNRWTRVGFG